MRAFLARTRRSIEEILRICIRDVDAKSSRALLLQHGVWGVLCPDDQVGPLHEVETETRAHEGISEQSSLDACSFP